MILFLWESSEICGGFRVDLKAGINGLV